MCWGGCRDWPWRGRRPWVIVLASPVVTDTVVAPRRLIPFNMTGTAGRWFVIWASEMSCAVRPIFAANRTFVLGC